MTLLTLLQNIPLKTNKRKGRKRPFLSPTFVNTFIKDPAGGVVAFAPKPFHHPNPIWQLFLEPDGLYGSLPWIPKNPTPICAATQPKSHPEANLRALTFIKIFDII